MRSRTALLLLCVLIAAASDSQDLYAAAGGQIVIPQETRLGHTTGAFCDYFVWKYQKSPDLFLKEIVSQDNRCMKAKCNRPDCSLSNNGSLIIHRVTHQDSGLYTIVTYHLSTVQNTQKEFQLHVLDPLLDPVLDVSCHPDGSVEISCAVRLGSDPLYSWIVDGRPLQSYTNSSWRVNGSIITGKAVSPWNVSCLAWNVVSQVQTPQKVVHCQDPQEKLDVAELYVKVALFVMYNALLVQGVLWMRTKASANQ